MAAASLAAAPAEPYPGFERRFGGLRRLYGEQGAQRIFSAHVLVVGVGGVGSWAAEALARSGVARLTLIDLDHVAESNVNRQLQALSDTLGQAKVQALKARVAQINPAASVQPIEAFVDPDNWLQLLAQASADQPPDAVLDACDHAPAKTTLAAWALTRPGLPFVTVGAAGGKRRAERVEIADLAQSSHDPLLARLRQRLRQAHAAPRSGPMGIHAVFSREPLVSPLASASASSANHACASPGAPSSPSVDTNASASLAPDGSLNCHGYGSSVAVTATFGLCAAGWLLERLALGMASTVQPHSLGCALSWPVPACPDA